MKAIAFSNDEYSLIYGLTFPEYKELKALQKKLFSGAFALIIDGDTESDPDYIRYNELYTKKWEFIRSQIKAK